MEIISGKTENTTINYFGSGSKFALLYFKNLLLTFFTLGIYYPWAKVEILQYHYQQTELSKKQFQLHAKPKEIFIGFLKVYAFFILFYLLFLIGNLTQNQTLVVLAVFIFYIFLFFLVPYAIHGTLRYRAAKSSWKNIFFKYLGDKHELFWLYVKGIFLTIITLGIYGAWFETDLRKYILSHLRFGDLSFDFKGTGKKLFWINLKFLLLFFLTFGIYTFWYVKELWSYYIDNVTVTQNEKTYHLKFKMTIEEVFRLVFFNVLLFTITFGIATPWITVRTFRYLFRHAEVDGFINTNLIQQVKYDDYDDATGESFTDFFEFDLI